MSSFKAFDIAGSGMAAQSVRLNTTASNLANAESVSGDANSVYKPRHPIFEAVRQQLGAAQAENGNAAVRVRGIYESQAPAAARYEPGNPDLKYRTPLAPALDGNTVDAQLEQSAFAENAVRYQATLTFLGAKFRGLMTAIMGS